MAYVEFLIGSQIEYLAELEAYNRTESFLAQNASSYGFSTTEIPLLTAEELDTLVELYESLPDWNSLGLPRTSPPKSLSTGRLTINLFRDKCPKTCENFMSLCAGSKGNSKSPPYKPLHYLNCKMHRIVKDFITQGGDITRNDGSGGDSIYGGKFNDEKQGLTALKFSRGTVAMANSGKNSNSSQFFITLTDDPKICAKKLDGKYVIFGQVAPESLHILDALNEVGTEEGTPTMDVIIGDCGLL